ncbi:unnamed protein product, partial [Brachionus calyciflorus]
MQTKKAKLVSTSHQKQMLFIDEYLFYKNQERPNGNIYWRCIEYNTEHKCPASVTTEGISTEILSFSKKNHCEYLKVDDLDTKVKDLLQNVKKRCKSEQAPMRQIYRDEINKLVVETKEIEGVAKKEKR